MALSIMQINIHNWKSNKYTLSVELSKYNTSIILVNELNVPPNYDVKLPGFNVIQKSHGPFTGSAVFIKKTLAFQEIYLQDSDIIAFKLFTSVGPLIISTAYFPPRYQHLPTLAFNKLLNHNLPTLIMGDFNAHHPIFDNTHKHHKHGDLKGKQLHGFMSAKNIDFLGPNFNTFLVNNRQGKPDLVLANRDFNIFHHIILAGDPIGSDHIPIIIKIQLVPITKVKAPKPIIRKLNIKGFKEALCNDEFSELDKQPVEVINSTLDTMYSNIRSATLNNCPISRTIKYKNYEPTPLIIQKMKQFQAAYLNYCLYGFPTYANLQNLKSNLTNLVIKHKITLWEDVMRTASDSYGDPYTFWRKINCIRGSIPSPPSYLISSSEISDSEDSEFGNTVDTVITDPQE